MIEENKKPDKEYKYEGYNIKIYYGDKPQDEVLKEIIEIKTNEYINKLSSME